MSDPLVDPVSETARWTAASRAQESARPDALFHDPLAEALATGRGRTMFERTNEGSGGDNPYLPIRTRWIDDRVVAAAREAPQVVFLAAGLDTRAFRLAWPAGAVVHEVDRPDLLAAKQEILDAAGATPSCERRTVGADLAGAWVEPLSAAGHRRDAPTLWIVEGLLIYLFPEQATDLLRAVAAFSAPGSVLLGDLIGTSMRDSPYTQDYLRLLEEQGTPWRFFVDDPAAVLAETGWTAVEVDEPGSPTADFGRWPYPRMSPDLPPEVLRDVPRSYLVRAVRS